MTTATRRAAMTGFALAAFAPGLAVAEVNSKQVPLKSVFPYLQAYLETPPEFRTHFTLAYYLKLNGAPQSALKAFFVEGGRRTPAPLGADGRAQRLPSLQQLKSDQQIVLEAPKGAKLAISLEVQPLVRPAQQISAPDLAGAVSQAADAVKKAAGLFGFAAPKMQVVVFRGAASGEVVAANGKTYPLPTAKGFAVFDPSRWPGARSVKLARIPERMLIGPAQ